MDLVAAVDHRHALNLGAVWDSVDLALVDAADEGRAGDQFPGVEVLRHVRARRGTGSPVIVIVTGHFMHDGLKYRMAQAGADFYFSRANLRSAEALLEVVLHPEQFRRGVPPLTDRKQLTLLGLTDDAEVEPLLSYAAQHGLESALADPKAVRDNPRGRHWGRRRREMAGVARIKTVNLTTGVAPIQDQDGPSLRQLQRLYRWAARVPSVEDRRSSGE